MKTYYRFLIALCLALWTAVLSAQTHWSFDHKQYKYDMTLYFMLQQNGLTPQNLSDYEVAAFINDECRGIGSVTTQTGSNGITVTYGYMRIYSNVTNGETITFRYFNKYNGEENDVIGMSVNFESNVAVGMPSNPLMFCLNNVGVPGDVNGDGDIDIVDVTSTIGYVIHQVPADFIFKAADVNNDGTVDIVDVTSIIDMIINKGKNVKKLNIEDAGNDPQ